MKKKKILIWDLILVVGTVLIILGGGVYVNYSKGVAFSPPDDVESTLVLFRFENVNRILVDIERGFGSAREYDVEDDLVITLEPGVYYWKLQGDGFSEVRKIETGTKVSFMLKELGDGSYWVVNADNAVLNVDKYKPNGEFEKSFSLAGGLK
ncbi:MAG: hypothetical protein KJ718_06065 [Nanoarchaeota archaeon]|nr:hypothetical protein [Nanoarchaeota archaeon]